MILVWLCVNGAEWLPLCLSLLSLSKSSAISQLLLKYESGDLMADRCHSAFIFSLHGNRLNWVDICEVWVLARLIPHPSLQPVREASCGMLALHLYFLFEDVSPPFV